MAAENPVSDKYSPRHKAFIIQIDRQEYDWSEEKIAGAQLRRLPADADPVRIVTSSRSFLAMPTARPKQYSTRCDQVTFLDS